MADNLARVSTHFALGKQQAELDFVDVDTDRDIPLFIDPFVFAQHHDAWSVQCHDAVVSYFETVLTAIAAGDHARGQSLLNNLREPNETCLGLSRGRPSGRGVGNVQAEDLFDRLLRSRAAATGLLSELSDCELFIEGIGSDKISDITTNIIRRQLIEYTTFQCDLHGIQTTQVASGVLWNANTGEWENQYVRLPVIEGRKILLVPKASARWSFAFSHGDYYNSFVLNYLQAQHLAQNTALVQVLRSGRRRVTKKSLRDAYPLSKHFLADFTEHHPDALDQYKRALGLTPGLKDSELDDNFNEREFATVLIDQLQGIERGNPHAERFHSYMVGTLEFIFYPHLIYPKKEQEIHQGRKRIDISYTNNSVIGFFFRRRAEPRVTASQVIVECKNYQKEIANPELDQIAGRFAPNRGRLGLLIGRSFDDRERFVARCRDTAQEDRGFVIALVDEDILMLLDQIRIGQRASIEPYLEQRFRELVS